MAMSTANTGSSLRPMVIAGIAWAAWITCSGGARLTRASTRRREVGPNPTSLLPGLAAATVRKPTVAQYTQYFRYLETGVCANSSGPYGEALRPPGMVVYRNFPKKRDLMGEQRVRKPL